MFSFSKPSEIEAWLREQWAGLFRELLKQRSQQKQLAALNSQVGELQSINTVLKSYLEVVINKVSPEVSANIIKDEETKLKNERMERIIESLDFYSYLFRLTDSKIISRKLLEMPKTQKEFLDMTDDLVSNPLHRDDIKRTISEIGAAQEVYNHDRRRMGIEPIAFTGGKEIKRKRNTTADNPPG